MPKEPAPPSPYEPRLRLLQMQIIEAYEGGSSIDVLTVLRSELSGLLEVAAESLEVHKFTRKFLLALPGAKEESSSPIIDKLAQELAKWKR